MDTEELMYPSVDHLTCVIYFGCVPQAMADMLEACFDVIHDLFGKRTVKGYYHYRDDSSIPLNKITRHNVGVDYTFELGQSWNEPKIECNRPLIYVAFASPRNSRRFVDYGFVECYWVIEYDSDPVSHGEHMGPCLRIDINLDRLGVVRESKIWNTVERLATIASLQEEFTNGFCDVADVYDTAMGVHYSATSIGSVRFQRQLEREIWAQSGDDRCHKFRGIFWGNLLGPRTVERLGGAKRLAKELPRGPVEDVSGLVRELPGGSVLFMLCKDIQEMRFPVQGLMPTTLERGAWLFEELLKVGLVCGQK